MEGDSFQQDRKKCMEGDSSTAYVSLFTVYGSAAQLEKDPLREMLKSEDASARKAAIKAIAQWGDEEAVALLAGLLHDRESAVRCAAVMAVGKLGVLAGGHLQTFKTMEAEDSDAQVRAVSKWAVKQIGDSVLAQHDGIISAPSVSSG
mmetsp:Transcript_102275/g.287607  ORF Transcript_102275/g.287607 Transcript_102275/m.287607 type:complete len:148 (-) Transcript_102275:138-581(-)